MGPPDLFDQGPLFGVPMGEDDVRVIDADHRAVSRHDDHVEPVQLTQLRRGGLGRAGHAAQAPIALHEMLQRDRAQDSSVGLALDAFLRLERRLQTIGPMTIGHDSARELVDDPDAALAHDVVDVSSQEHLRMKRAIELGQHAIVLRIVEAADAKRTLDLFDPGLGQLDVTAVLVGVEMDARCERGHERGQPRRARDLATDTAGDDQRHARLVDEERVGFVHEREMERAVNELLTIDRQQIAQMIESRFFGGHIGDVGEVGATAFLGRHALLNESDRQPQHRVHGPHPLGVPARQVIIERQHVRALTCEGAKRRRHDGSERLPLAGLHLDDVAAIQRDRGEDLDIERPQAEDSARGVASERKERGANRFRRATGTPAQLARACLNRTV